jgi:hypothetical protein
MHRLPGLAAALMFVVVVACTGEAPTTPGGSSSPPPTTRPSVAASAARPDVAVVRVRTGTTFETLAVDARTDTILTRLPDGPLSPDRRALFAARPAAGDTQVEALDPATGTAIAYRTVAGRWVLPTIGVDRTPIGLSSDGSALVLAAVDPATGHSAFAVVAADLSSDPTVIDLLGDLDVDGLSPGGTTLYLVERRDGRDYAIRSVDVRTGTLDVQPVVDKREGEEAMVGSAVGRIGSDTWLHTLYLADEPFLHSLDASNKFTFCIELSRSVREARELALAMAPDGARGWVIDVSTGRMSGVNVSDGSAAAPQAVPGLAPAAEPASTSESVTFDPTLVDGDRILVATPRGLVAISTSHRTATLVSGEAMAGIGRSRLGAVVAVTGSGVATTIDR